MLKNKLKNKIIGIILAASAVLSVLPAIGAAAAAPGADDYVFTLQAGFSCEIINASPSPVTVGNYSNSKAKYDMVSYGAAGNAVNQYKSRRGDSNFTIPENGKVRITANNTYRLNLYVKNEDKASLEIKETAMPAFYYFTLRAGKNYEITNTAELPLAIRNYSGSDAVYDIVNYDAEGNSPSQSKDRRGDNNITIGDRGRARVTTSPVFELNLYIKCEDKEQMSIYETAMPAFYFFALQAGTVHEIINTDTASVTVKNCSAGNASYDITYYNAAGKLTSQSKDRRGDSNFTIGDRGKAVITANPKFGLDLYVKYEDAPKLNGIPEPLGGYLRNILTPFEFPAASDRNIYEENEKIALTPDKIPDVSGVTDISAIKQTLSGALTEVLEALTPVQKAVPAIADLAILFSEEAISQMSASTVPPGDIRINSENIAEPQAAAAELRDSAMRALIGADMEAIREMDINVTFKTTETKKVTITAEPSSVDANVDNICVETPDFTVIIPMAAIIEGTRDGELVITAEKLRGIGGSLSIVPVADSADARGSIKVTLNKNLAENIKVSFDPAAGDPVYQAVFRSDGTSAGGKYNPVTKKVTARIRHSDTYTVRENKRSFTDISEKSSAMQEAIGILAAKGIINGVSPTRFSPDDPITRAEIAALIVRTLSRLDPNADGNFKDVKRSDWYFGAVGSAKAYGIIQGTSPTLFEPDNQILKEQIIAIAARTLKNEMKYKTPEDTDRYLRRFADKTDLPAWGAGEFALASMADLIVARADGLFDPAGTMTRGDAAIVLYRLFMKIW